MLQRLSLEYVHFWGLVHQIAFNELLSLCDATTNFFHLFHRLLYGIQIDCSQFLVLQMLRLFKFLDHWADRLHACLNLIHQSSFSVERLLLFWASLSRNHVNLCFHELLHRLVVATARIHLSVKLLFNALQSAPKKIDWTLMERGRSTDTVSRSITILNLVLYINFLTLFIILLRKQHVKSLLSLFAHLLHHLILSIGYLGLNSLH